MLTVVLKREVQEVHCCTIKKKTEGKKSEVDSANASGTQALTLRGLSWKKKIPPDPDQWEEEKC